MGNDTKVRNSMVRAIQTLAALVVAASAHAQDLANVDCSTPPPAHCMETCAPELLGELGNALDPKTGRAFFLDFPCDLAPAEKVIFILSIHGAGSIGNWQRHYFPALDFKDEYRLVIATPTAVGSGAIGERSVRMWTPAADDEYLRNIVDLVIERFGRQNIRSFWLAGHSQGGVTSNRLVCTEYFRDKVDGWLSLSGGRIGRAEIAPDFFGPDGPPAALASNDPDAPRPGSGVMPACPISFIFTSGEHEIVELPTESPIALRYGCDGREQRDDIVDTVKGYLTGATPGRGPSWGREARPGTAEVYVYPNCDGGRIVADVLRLDKGHTEGLEPRVTEALIAMMADAPGGKLAARLDPSLSRMFVPTLVAWIEATREEAEKRGLEEMPSELRGEFVGHVPARVLERVRWRVDDTAYSVQQNLFRLGHTQALTVDNVILFANLEEAAKPALWAHELCHVVQFSDWGLDGFAARYLADYGAVEHAANEFAWQWLKATDRVPVAAR